MLEFVAALAQKAPQDIHRNKSAEVTDVAVIVNRWAASVHADGIVRGGRELFHLAGKRVVKTQGQTVIVAKERRSEA